MTANEDTPVVYCSTDNVLIDLVKTLETNDQALARLAEYGEGLVILTLKEAIERQENAAKTAPVEITQRKFSEMLCILPPVQWLDDGASERFKMSECKSGLITGIYVRLGDRYFSFDDEIGLSHDQCCSLVLRSDAFKPPPPIKKKAGTNADTAHRVGPTSRLPTDETEPQLAAVPFAQLNLEGPAGSHTSSECL